MDSPSVYRSVWGETIYFSGTREALIAAGVCRDDVFPGDPGDKRKVKRRGGRTGRFATTDPQGRTIYIIQTYLGDRTFGFQVRRSDLTPEERAEGEAQERRREEERAAIERRRAEVLETQERERSDSISDMEPGDVARMIDNFSTTALLDDSRTWRMSEEDWNRIVGLKMALVEAIRNARVIRAHVATVHHLRLVKA